MAGMAPNLAIALRDLPQTALRLCGVGEGEAGEESHDCLLRFECNTG
jgi:hypothetical protein